MKNLCTNDRDLGGVDNPNTTLVWQTIAYIPQDALNRYR